MNEKKETLHDSRFYHFPLIHTQQKQNHQKMEGTVSASTSIEEICLLLREVSEREARVTELVPVLMKAAAVTSKTDLYRFYELGGVAQFCRILETHAEDCSTSDHIDFKTVTMMLCQTLLGVGQIRSYMSLKGRTLTYITKIATSLLLLKDLSSGSESELVSVKVMAALCLNSMPLMHDEWVLHGIPELAMELLSDESYPKYGVEQVAINEETRSDGLLDEKLVNQQNLAPSSLLDAGLLLLANFCASQEFYNRVMELGIAEQLTIIAHRLCTTETEVKDGLSFAGTILRYITLLSVLYAVDESREKLDFLQRGHDEDVSIIEKLLPELAMHEKVEVRSMAHQLLAEYTGVSPAEHEWVFESIPASNVNETEPAFDLTRQCSLPLCIKEEEAPLAFKWCSKCKIPVYCSQECQKADWKQHKHLCKTLGI